MTKLLLNDTAFNSYHCLYHALFIFQIEQIVHKLFNQQSDITYRIQKEEGMIVQQLNDVKRQGQCQKLKCSLNISEPLRSKPWLQIQTQKILKEIDNGTKKFPFMSVKQLKAFSIGLNRYMPQRKQVITKVKRALDQKENEKKMLPPTASVSTNDKISKPSTFDIIRTVLKTFSQAFQSKPTQLTIQGQYQSLPVQQQFKNQLAVEKCEDKLLNTKLEKFQ